MCTHDLFLCHLGVTSAVCQSRTEMSAENRQCLQSSVQPHRRAVLWAARFEAGFTCCCHGVAVVTELPLPWRWCMCQDNRASRPLLEHPSRALQEEAGRLWQRE